MRLAPASRTQDADLVGQVPAMMIAGIDDGANDPTSSSRCTWSS